MALLPRRGLDLADRHVVVTGAASGIGRALVLDCARRGAVVHLVDVDGGGLASVAEEVAALLDTARGSGRVGSSAVVDLTDEPAVAAWAAGLLADHGPADVVACVAGIAVWGTVRALRPEDWRRVVEVNLMGTVHVVEHLVPAMSRRAGGRGGHLVLVSSAAGIIGMPWHAAYSASKFGVRGMAEVLRFDQRKHGVGVHLVCPGAVATPLVDSMRIAGVDGTTSAFRRARAGFRRGAVSPEKASAALLDGVARGRYWIYTSPDIRLLHAVERHLPRVYALMMRAFGAGANRLLPDVERAER